MATQRIHPNSLRNLALGPATKKKDKRRTNFTLLPKTLEILSSTKNKSKAIDEAIALIEEMNLVEELQKRVQA